MLGIKVPLPKAEEVRRLLIEKGLYRKGYKPLRLANAVVFPITQWREELKAWGEPFSAHFPSRGRPANLREALERRGIRAELRAFDLIGDVAIIEIPEELWERRFEIGEALAEVHSVGAVYAKKSAMEGTYRVRKLELIWGEDRDVALYREHGVVMEVPFKEAFFSPRLSTERARIAQQVKPGEKVLVLFAGVGPFALVIAKACPTCEVVGVELNPKAVEAFQRNVELNKLTNVRVVLGDAAKFSEKGFDRVLMPLPKDAEKFLSVAEEAVRNRGIIHLYSFVDRRQPLAELLEKVRDNMKSHIQPLFWKRVRDYSPTTIQMVLDFRVWKDS